MLTLGTNKLTSPSLLSALFRAWRLVLPASGFRTPGRLPAALLGLVLLATACAPRAHSPPPAGALLGDGWSPAGFLDESTLVVHDDFARTVSLVSTDSGAILTSLGVADYALIAFDTVFLYTYLDSSLGTVAIDTYAIGRGRSTLATNGNVFPWWSKDGSFLLYSDDVSSDGQYASLVTSRPDGSGRQLVAANVIMNQPGVAALDAVALGSGFLIVYCTDPGFVCKGVFFDPASGSSQDVVGDNGFLSLRLLNNGTASRALISTFAQTIVVDAPATTTTLPGSPSASFLCGDGTVYMSDQNGVSTFDVSTQRENTVSPFLQPAAFDAESPDGSTLLVEQQNPQAFHGLVRKDGTDISYVAAGNLALRPPYFTADSGFVLYFDQVLDVGYFVGGRFNVAPIGGGTPVLTVDNAVVIRQLAGSRLLVQTNVSDDYKFDAILVDAKQPSATTTLVSQASWIVLSTGGSVAYMLNDGIYLTTVR
jgi:hypothetical protein